MNSDKALRTVRRNRQVLLLDFFAAIMFGAALVLHAFARTPLGIEAFYSHFALAFALIAAVAAHNILGRRPLYWSHFDFLIAVFFGFVLATLHYSEARAVTATALTWVIDGVWAYLLGRYLLFRRLRLCNLVILAVCLGVWVLTEILLARVGTATKDLADGLYVRLEPIQGLAWSVGVVLLLAQPFFLLRKPANIVFVLWSAALLFGLTVWFVQQLIVVLDAYRLGRWDVLSYPQVMTVLTAKRLLLAYPIVGSGTATWPWLSAAFRPVGYVELPSVVPGLLRMPCEWGCTGALLFAVAWLRVPWYALRHWALFPNRRLRMSVLVFLSLMLLGFGRLFIADDFAQPWGWALWWAIAGTFVSLVSVRDPLRIFFENVQVVPSPDLQRLAVSERRKSSLLAQPPKGYVIRVATVAVVVMAILFLQALPHRAAALVQRLASEPTSSPDYGRRLERAVRMFPFFAEGWAKLAQHYQERCASDSLALLALAPRIESAYRNAIEANPYEPNYYEQLAFFYQDTNAAPKVLETLRTAVANNPNHFVVRLLLVRELERSQSYALATWHLRQALFRIAPQQSELFVKLAELYDLRGMRSDAVRACQYACQGLPPAASAVLRLKRIAERLGIAKVLL